MKKRIARFLLGAILVCSFIPAVFAASEAAVEAADALHELGLFNGTGTTDDGAPIYELDRVPNRQEAITMLVRLLGKETEALEGTWETPFTDVEDWAKPYVGYAYENGLTTGTGDTTFGGAEMINATQYLTFVLRALGYDSNTDFEWDKAWELSDEISLTNGQYQEANNLQFMRSGIATISFDALSIPYKNDSMTIGGMLAKEGSVQKADLAKLGVEEVVFTSVVVRMSGAAGIASVVTHFLSNGYHTDFINKVVSMQWVDTGNEVTITGTLQRYGAINLPEAVSKSVLIPEAYFAIYDHTGTVVEYFKLRAVGATSYGEVLSAEYTTTLENGEYTVKLQDCIRYCPVGERSYREYSDAN